MSGNSYHRTSTESTNRMKTAFIDAAPGYAKTEAQWPSWVVHCHYWRNATGKIAKMSLQYAD